jgi:hypothetical protein
LEQQSYWITADLPSEAELTPALWGQLTFH